MCDIVIIRYTYREEGSEVHILVLHKCEGINNTPDKYSSVCIDEYFYSINTLIRFTQSHKSSYIVITYYTN